MRINYVTLTLCAVALLVLGALTFTGRSTEAFLAGAVSLIGLAQSHKAVRKKCERHTDDINCVPDLSGPSSRDSETKPSIPIKIAEAEKETPK